MKFFVLALAFWIATPTPARSDFATVTPEEYYYASARIDKLLHDSPPAPARLVEMNAAIDTATKLYRDRKSVEAIRVLNDAAITLLPDDADKDSYRVVWSLAVALPQNLTTHTADAAIVFKSMYPVTVSSPTMFWTDLSAAGTPLLQTKPTLHKVTLPTSGLFTLSLPLKDVIAGHESLVVNLAYSADELTETRRYLVPGADVDGFKKQYLKRLADTRDIKGVDPGYERARRIATERVNLLSGIHSTTNATQFLLEPDPFQRSLYHEFKLLTSGLNPYRNDPGDIWRPVISSDPAKRAIACRVYVPANLPRDKGAPLVIALHDEEGDENSFLEAYGKGQIKQLADEFHVVVACPNIRDLGWQSLKELIDQVAEDQHIDRTRVFLLGHGSGAEVAAACAREGGESLAAVVCFCGGELHALPNAHPVPALVYGAQLDFITPAAHIADLATKALGEKLPVEYRVVENQGHTLVVIAKLREAMVWVGAHSTASKK